jgi:type I restriction enzyme, S subunit
MNLQNHSFSEPKARMADELNQERRKIDELIQVQKQLLELLDEKRYALINHAVSRGINPHIPIRYSGIEWIGKIPQHWQVIKLRHCILSIEPGKSLKAYEKEPDTQEWGILKLNAVKRGEFDDSQAKTIPVSVKIPTSLEIHPGDFLITRANNHDVGAKHDRIQSSVLTNNSSAVMLRPYGDVCYVHKTRPKLVLSHLMYRLRLDESKLDGQFLSYFLQSYLGRWQIEANGRVSSRYRVKIYSDQVLDWRLLLPPLQEQKSIVDDIETKLDKINALKTITYDTIELFQERRTAIITPAVSRQMTIKESQNAN